ncbi:hypothetical protein BC828DRAFT_403701 [Blastocladiella britannica]|nr:hypothetical protein BC828DRAFT_403701 [Blastocladiella britannica]
MSQSNNPFTPRKGLQRTPPLPSQQQLHQGQHQHQRLSRHHGRLLASARALHTTAPPGTPIAAAQRIPSTPGRVAPASALKGIRAVSRAGGGVNSPAKTPLRFTTSTSPSLSPSLAAARATPGRRHLLAHPSSASSARKRTPAAAPLVAAPRLRLSKLAPPQGLPFAAGTTASSNSRFNGSTTAGAATGSSSKNPTGNRRDRTTTTSTTAPPPMVVPARIYGVSSNSGGWDLNAQARREPVSTDLADLGWSSPGHVVCVLECRPAAVFGGYVVESDLVGM